MRITAITRAGIAIAAMVLSAGTATAQSAADLRTALNRHLVEHAFLAAAVTGAALGERATELKAARTALDANSRDLAHAIGAVYGDESGKAFLELWRQHIVFLVDYTRATGARNRAMRDDAVRNLAGYVEDFAAFLAAANPNLPEPAVADLLRTHVAGLMSLVDAQAAEAFDSAHVHLRGIAAHMQRIGDPLAAAIARQFPHRFPAP